MTSRTERITRQLTVALLAWTTLIAVFAVHRGLSFQYLLPSGGLDSESVWRSVVVGLLSDAWIAVLLAVVAGVLGSWRGPAFGWVGFWVLLTCGHQTYVKFFHFPIIPQHLSYLWDRAFLEANSGAILDWANAFIVLVGAAVLFGGDRLRIFKRWTPLALRLGAATLVLLALAGHNRNIHYRVQWFIPENLQTNGLEGLAIRAKLLRAPDPLSEKETAELAAALETNAPAVHPSARETFKFLSRSVDADAPVAPVAAVIRAAFRALRVAGKKPLFVIALMESQRPSETGYFSLAKPSLTPRLDTLAQAGIALTRVHSTGSVTRGGQEAVICGYLGSRDYSLMRGTSLAAIECLPDVIARSDAVHPGGGSFFWHHGGEGKFDRQADFWRLRHVGDLLALSDFSAQEPRTGWGIGDQTFFNRSFDRINTFRKDAKTEFVAGLMLSVSNHIPWDLPDDAQSDLAANPEAAAHPSYRTTSYSDHALGTFVDRAKSSGMWDQLVLLVVSDHGNNVPPYSNLYGASPFQAEELQSHVNFVVTGGIAESAVKAAGRDGIDADRERSQTGAAAFAAYVLDLNDVRFMGENPFAAHQVLPVISDLEEGVYFPALGRYWPRSNLLASDDRADSSAAKTAALYYRAFLGFIQRPAISPEQSDSSAARQFSFP